MHGQQNIKIYCPRRELNQDSSDVEPIALSLYRLLSPGSKLSEEMTQIRLPARAIVRNSYSA